MVKVILVIGDIIDTVARLLGREEGPLIVYMITATLFCMQRTPHRGDATRAGADETVAAPSRAIRARA